MAKKQITDLSSPAEKQKAAEQLRAAEQEYKTYIDAWPKASSVGLAQPGPGDYYIDPRDNSPMTLAKFDTLRENIASQYDYVDFGAPPQSAPVSGRPLEVAIGGERFFVQGLNDQTPAGKDVKSAPVASDDAYRPPSAPQALPNQTGNNPNAAKTSQGGSIDTNGQTASQVPGVEQTTQSSNSVTQTEKAQAEKSVAMQEKNAEQSSGTGVVNDQPNNQLTNNRPGRLSDEFQTFDNAGQGDDKGKIARPMGAALGGFGNNGISVTPDPGKEGTGGVTIGTTQQSTVPPQKAGTKNNPNVPVTPNVLHSYVNWTYKIGFYMLDVSNYNTVVSGGNPASGQGKYPIAVSGGYARGQAGAIDLQGDVYIDSLRFTSIIGNRQAGAGTNNIDLEMVLIEPYGASLIGELAILAKTINSKVNLSEIPYLLEIDFTGYKDDGTPVKSILEDAGKKKKLIPVKVLSIDMKLESAGARYTLQMVPYSLFAYTTRYGNIPKETWVYGETVNDILGTSSTGLIGRLNAIEKEKVEKDKTQEFPDVYDIKFYSFNKAGTNTGEMPTSKVAYPTEGGPATIIKNRKIDENKPTKQGYTIKAGTVIKEAIKDLVMVSEYFNLKMKPNQPNSSKEPAELIKVIPVIKLQDKWDNIRNEFPKEITFHVTNTLLFGELYPYGGQAPLEDWGYPKEYNYLFTGKNDDILNVDLEFNLLYYQNFFPDLKENSIIRTDVKSPTDKAPASTTSNQGIAAPSVKAGAIASYAPNESSRYINSQLAAEFFDMKMNNSNADLINLDMSIIGDPDWIPQDASVRGGNIIVANSERKDSNGSIAIDVAGVYVKLQLRTPRDYNDATGLMDLQQDKTLVGGVYQVITVENQFQGGKFTSMLNMVKVPKQEENYLQNYNRDRQN